jgi:hypothetical protein
VQSPLARNDLRSVLGFGGLLFNGELFAVILFSTVHVSATAADRFRTLAPDVKSVFTRFSEAEVFNQTLLSSVGGTRTQQEKNGGVYGFCLTHRQNENAASIIGAVFFLGHRMGGEDNVD